MGLDFSFARVPFTEDGDTYQLYLFDPEDPEDRSDELVEGVQLMGFQGKLNTVFPIGSISNGVIEEITEGVWSRFLEGGPLSWDSNGRFILLRSRKEQMALLRQCATKLPERQRTMLLTLLDECENMLNQCTDVVLVIN